MSSDIQPDNLVTPNTSNRIALQMQNVRQTARAANLPQISSVDGHRNYNESSTFCVVNLANINPEHNGLE